MMCTLQRQKYYCAWRLGIVLQHITLSCLSVGSTDAVLSCAAEAVNMMAGFGFDGYDEKGREKWDLLNNANIYEIEVRADDCCSSFKL